jgi:hypothetical protein
MKSLRSIGLAAIGAVALLGLGLSQAEAAGKPIHSPPYNVDVYVRGSFNGWGLGHKMTFDGVENQYVAYVELTSGGHEFKIASADWATVDLGAADDGIVDLGVPEPIAHVSHGNLYLEVADAAVYSFKFDVSDPDHLTVLVEYARKGGDGSQIYIWSSGGAWSFDCLGVANPVVGAITIKGVLNARQNPAGGWIYRDMQQLKGVAYDQNGVEYRFTMSSTMLNNGPPNGSVSFTQNVRGKWISQGGTPDLYLIYHHKIRVGPLDDVKREIDFYADGCR